MSNTGNGYTVIPRIIDAITPALYPKIWKNGFTIRYRSPRCVPASSFHSAYSRSVGACGIITPLGRPVVPDVKTMSATSSAATFTSAGVPLVRKSDFRSIFRTDRGVSYSFPRNPRWVRTIFAPLLVMMSAASAALNRVLTGTRVPPAASRPNAAMIHSAELEAQIAVHDRLRVAETVGGG